MRHSLWSVSLALGLFPTFVYGDDPANVLLKAPSRFAKSNEYKVHYKSLGEGNTALVFIHGWCGDHTVWTNQAGGLHGKLRMIFIDLPGYGKSDRPKVDYTMDFFAKGIDAVLKDAGVEHAVLAGHSMGTPVVRQFYRLYPLKTQALILVDGSLRPFSKDRAEGQKFLSMFQEETFREVAPKFLSAMLTSDSPAALREKVELLALCATPSVAISSMHAMLDQKLWKEDKVKVPVLALMARAPFWTDEYKAHVKKLVPDLDYREFDGVGHFLFMEKPKEINEVLIEFLKKQGVVR